MLNCLNIYRILVGLGLLMVLGGCTSTLEQVFMDCKLEIDENRHNVRKTGHYSYSYNTYRECMRPIRLQIDIEEWEPPRFTGFSQ